MTNYCPDCGSVLELSVIEDCTYAECPFCTYDWECLTVYAQSDLPMSIFERIKFWLIRRFWDKNEIR